MAPEYPVKGKVYGMKALGNMVLVNVGAAYPNQLLTIVLKGKAKDLAKKLENKAISVVGTVIYFKGKPEIVITDPKMISIFKWGFGL
jgi:hypothetical protein